MLCKKIDKEKGVARRVHYYTTETTHGTVVVV